MVYVLCDQHARNNLSLIEGFNEAEPIGSRR